MLFCLGLPDKYIRSLFYIDIVKELCETCQGGSRSSRHLQLLFAVRVDARAVLRADIVFLPVQRRGIVAREEQVDQLLVRHLHRNCGLRKRLANLDSWSNTRRPRQRLSSAFCHGFPSHTDTFGIWAQQ